jgi:ABC-2 type transport system permease protein
VSVDSLAGERLGANLWRYVGKLLRLRWVILISGFRRAKLRGKIGTLVLLLLALGGLTFAFWLSWMLLDFLRSPQLAEFIGDTTYLLSSVPVVVVTVAFIGILMTGFGVLLQALYLAGDMEFLLSAPIPIRAVFLTKQLQAILPNFLLISLFALPVLFGLGAAQGYNLLYYPLVIIELALLAMAAAGLASLLVMAVVRIFPARRVAEVLGFLVAIVSFTCSQSGQLVNYADVSGEQAMQAFAQLERINTPWSPLAWAGRGLTAIGESQWLTGVGLLAVTMGLTLGIFGLSLVFAERLYYSGWARVQVSIRPKKPARASRRVEAHNSGLAVVVNRLVPAAVRGILVKDFMVLRRDLRSMSQLVTPLILGVVYAFMLLRSGGEPPAGRGEAPPVFMEVLGNLMLYANVGIAMFVSWSLVSRLAGMGFSQEGKSYWILKSSPVSQVSLIGAKFLVAYLPTLVLGWGFLVIISLVQTTSFGTLIYSLAVVALTIAGTAGLNLAFGVLGANFDWEDPRKISQGSVGCLGALASFLFLIVSLTLFFGPALLVSAFGGPQFVGQFIGMLLGGAVCAAGAIIPLWLVRKRVALLAEE